MVRHLVVVGASTGGVAALRAMVRGFPGGLDAAVLVVPHIPARAPSALSRILACSAALLAVTVRNGGQVTRDRIYVAPADQPPLVRYGRIALPGDPAGNRHRPAIDPLFRSAARFLYPRAIGGLVARAPGTTPPADDVLAVGLNSSRFVSHLVGAGRDVPFCPEACGDRDQS